jgi:adenylate cyclase class 2
VTGPHVPPPVESEIKLRMDDPEAARRALAALGAVRTHARHFEDNTLFDRGRESLLRSGRTLRVRRAAGRALVTYKGPREDRADGLKHRPEIEVEVADADAFEALLAALGYRKSFRYQKYRETYAWGGVEIMVDEMPIGSYLEIEGPPESIHAAARALGFGPGDYIVESYTSLFAAAGRHGDVVFE